MNKIEVVLVNQQGEDVGTAEKLQAHQEALLHKAFSIFIFNSQGELLITRRAEGKYHSGGLWANTCCSHPRPGESLKEATRRRLQEEIGLDCETQEVFHFIYNEPVGNGLWEHEDDHVFVGYCDETPAPDPEETSEWEWISLPELHKDVQENPEQYAPWFRVILHDHADKLRPRK